MKKLYYATALSLGLILSGCGPSNPGVSPFAKKERVYGFSFIEGTVVENFGNKVIVQIDGKDVVVGDPYESKLTNKIIKSSLFIKDMDTNIGKYTAKVEDVRGSQVTFTFAKESMFQANEKVKIFIPKKTIAIMDFSLIGSSSSNIEKFALEDMTTKMVQSGQYTVVERSKLDTILKEQELIDSGMLDERDMSKIGKLVAADVILTGSFTKKQNKWKVNLRLVDVETGIILSAINDTISGEEFRPKQLNDTKNITEDFEDENYSSGWIKRIVEKNKAKAQGIRDTTTGANGSSSSLKNKGSSKKRESAAVFLNKKYRDVSQFTGIRFFAKSNKSASITFNMHDKNYNSEDVNRWNSIVSVSKQWKEYKIPFDELQLGKNYAKKILEEMENWI